MYIEQKQDKILRPTSVYTRTAQEDNQITTELLNLIRAGGLTPSANNLQQVKNAVMNIAGSGGGGGGVGHTIGEIVYSCLPIVDDGFHLLDGSLIDGSGSYEGFVDYIAGLVNDYPDLFETEANWQSSVTTYGVCGKFVYDSVNHTVRLPKITGFTEGTITPTTLGDLTEAGLPNITGMTTGIYNGDNVTVTGAFSFNATSKNPSVSGGAAAVGATIDFDASDSNSKYGNSNTVQPQSIKVLFYIVIATTTKTDIQVDIDQIATDLNGKADVDLTNVNDTGTSKSAGWAMPSDVYDDLTLGASGSTYTAPANGWFYFNKTANSSLSSDFKYIALYSSSGLGCDQNGAYQFSLTAVVPVKKGDVVTASYNATGNTNHFKFIYAEGSKTEA